MACANDDLVECDKCAGGQTGHRRGRHGAGGTSISVRGIQENMVACGDFPCRKEAERRQRDVSFFVASNQHTVCNARIQHPRLRRRSGTQKKEGIKMYDFPRAQMRVTELVEMGFRRAELKEAYESRGQQFARKQNPARRNSPIVFDTAGLSKYLAAKAAASQAQRKAVI